MTSNNESNKRQRVKYYLFYSGYEYKLNLKETRYSHLPPPYGPCDDDAWKPDSCMDKCHKQRTEEMQKQCGCSSGTCLVIPNVVNACAGSATTVNCTEAVMKYERMNNCSYKYERSQLNCNCPYPCNFSDYDVTQTSKKVSGDVPRAINALWNGFDNAKRNMISTNFANFNLATQTTVFKIAIDQKVFSSKQVIAFTLCDFFTELYFHTAIVILILANLMYVVNKGKSCSSFPAKNAIAHLSEKNSSNPSEKDSSYPHKLESKLIGHMY